jgi:hypothetical protein
MIYLLTLKKKQKMIRSFNTTKEENIGFYCGLLTSFFAMAQFVSGKDGINLYSLHYII